MRLEDARVGFALCGSYCTYAQVFAALEALVPQAGTVIPILSEQSGCRDTRFGAAADFRARLETLCGNPVLDSIVRHCGDHGGKGPPEKRTAGAAGPLHQ